MYFKSLFNRKFILMLLLALFMPWQTKAQETLTVCDGTNSTLTTNNQVPMYGNYFDDYTKSEFVIPAEKLSEMDGAEISSIKFYISAVGSYGSGWSGTHQVVFLKEVESATLSAFGGMEDATVVFDGMFEEPATNATEFEIVFSTNYQYQGGNLLIGIYNTDDGGYRNVTWYGETVNGASGAGSHSSYLNNVSFSQKNFIPKTTFTYTPAGGVSCAKPKSLNTVDITAHTATLTWTAGAEGQSNWDVFVTTDATVVPDENTEPTYQVTECSKTLSGLTGETTYYAYVRSVCGGTDGYSTWAKKVFTTTVACPVPTLTVLVDTRTAYSVDLQWTGNAAADQFEVAYSTTSNFDPNGTEANGVYHRTVEVTPASSHTWTLDGLNPETTYRMRVRANCGGDDGSSSWSDQKSVTTLPTCVAPSNLSATATATSITLNWTAGAQGQDAWDIRYKKSTDSEYASIHLDNHPTTSYTITDLSPVTTYGVNVRAWCSETDQSKWGASTANQSYDKSVTTACGAIELPYTCDFEGTSQTVNNCTIPSCWSVIRGYYNSTYRYGVPTMATPSTSTQPVVQQTHSGSYSLYFLNSTNYGTTEEYAILPEISGDYNMRDIQISFWVRSNNVDCQMEVGVMTDPSNANTYVKVAEVEISSTYTKKIIGLSSYTGKGRYIALKCPAASMYSQAFYVDDILVEYIPSCQVPDNLAADEVGVNEVSLSWTPRGDESAWNIQYKEASDDEWSDPIAVYETTYTLTGLQRSTLYEARVQANCDDNDQSDWTNPISFTTECGIWTIDDTHALVENFNSASFPPTCWQKVNFGEMGVTNGWLQTFNNPLDSQGAVSSDFKNETWLFLPQMHLDGNATLSFDNLFSTGTSYCTSSIMVSTDAIDNLESIKEEGFIGEHFTQIWAADPTNLPSNKQNETVSLSNYNGQDVYIAFRYEGSYTTGQRTWYIDNVEVYVEATQAVTLTQGWNWWSPTVETTLEELETAIGINGITIKSQDAGFADYDEEDQEWTGNLDAIVSGQMYKIQVNAECIFTLSGKALSNVNITIEQGHNWFGYTGLQTITINQAFENFTPAEGDRINAFDGHFANYEDGEWIGNLTHLQPGQGYIYNSQDTNSKTLIFNKNQLIQQTK